VSSQGQQHDSLWDDSTNISFSIRPTSLKELMKERKLKREKEEREVCELAVLIDHQTFSTAAWVMKRRLTFLILFSQI
jgi:hypothetical protein